VGVGVAAPWRRRADCGGRRGVGFGWGGAEEFPEGTLGLDRGR
jgi:hypothetical protein